MEANLLTTKETAEKLRISLRTLYGLLESGKVSAVRIAGDGRILFRPTDVDEALVPYETRRRDR